MITKTCKKCNKCVHAHNWNRHIKSKFHLKGGRLPVGVVDDFKIKNENARKTANLRTQQEATTAKRFNAEDRVIEDENIKKRSFESQRIQQLELENQELERKEDSDILEKLDISNLKKTDSRLINKLHNTQLRNRLLHELNLQTSNFYKNVQNELKFEKERRATNAGFNGAVSLGVSAIPGVGKYTKDVYDATGAELSKQNNFFIKQYQQLLEQYPELADGPYQQGVDLSEITGGGFGDWLKSASNWVSNKFSKRLSFNNTSQKTLQNFGKFSITSGRLAKKPIHQMLDKVLNLLSLGKWKEAKGQDFDKLYHTAIILLLDNGTQILIEKVEEVMVTSSLKNIEGSDTEYLSIDIPNKMSLQNLCDTCVKSNGNDKFFGYSALGSGSQPRNNCQDFIMMICTTLGCWTPQAKDFIYQDITKLQQGTPQYVKTIANAATDMGNIFSKFMGKGKILHAIKIHNDVPIEQHMKHLKNITKSNKKRLCKVQKNYTNYRILPKTHFKKGKFSTKKYDDNITLVFGELLNAG